MPLSLLESLFHTFEDNYLLDIRTLEEVKQCGFVTLDLLALRTIKPVGVLKKFHRLTISSVTKD